jgi:DNA-binding transcriptional ArsR family regulator
MRASVQPTPLADPTRAAILSRLASRDTAIDQLAEPLRMSLPAASKNRKPLEQWWLAT